MDPLDEFEQLSGLGLNTQLSWSRLGLRLGGLDYNTTDYYTLSKNATNIQ